MRDFKNYFIVGTNDNALHDTMNGNVIGELIRCKDCKYYIWEIDMCNEPYSTARNIVRENDYCSLARKRKG